MNGAAGRGAAHGHAHLTPHPGRHAAHAARASDRYRAGATVTFTGNRGPGS